MNEIAALLDVIVWPTFALIFIGLYYRNIKSLIETVKIRIEQGATITTPVGSLGPPPLEMKAPEQDEPVTENNMALTHSSWRYPNKDLEYKRTMYCFHTIIQAPNEVLDRIEYVNYHLHPTYPNSEQTITNRASQFKLKELAWGESNLKADIKIKNQDELIKLNRFINLNETGPKIP